jgi:hypothetical protein
LKSAYFCILAGLVVGCLNFFMLTGPFWLDYVNSNNKFAANLVLAKTESEKLKKISKKCLF